MVEGMNNKIIRYDISVWLPSLVCVCVSESYHSRYRVSGNVGYGMIAMYSVSDATAPALPTTGSGGAGGGKALTPKTMLVTLSWIIWVAYPKKITVSRKLMYINIIINMKYVWGDETTET